MKKVQQSSSPAVQQRRKETKWQIHFADMVLPGFAQPANTTAILVK
jgi:hypothetical protein